MLALTTRGTVLQPARQVPATTAATSSGGIVVILVRAGPGPGCAMFVVVAQLAAFRCIIHIRVSARNEVVAVVVSRVELFAGIVARRRRGDGDRGLRSTITINEEWEPARTLAGIVGRLFGRAAVQAAAVLGATTTTSIGRI